MRLLSPLLFTYPYAPDDTVAIQGAETVHDAGLTDQEAAGNHPKRTLRKEVLKDKGKYPFKTVYSVH